MAHSHLRNIEAETHRASGLLILTLLGGMLVLSSFVVDQPAVAKTLFQYEVIRGPDGRTANPFADVIALAGAVLLGAPLIWHALTCLAHGETHMEELVSLAIVAAIALGDYQEAGIIAFFMVISNLIETRTALGARASIESLLRLTPERAHRIMSDGIEEVVDAKDLRPGDVIRVRPGGPGDPPNRRSGGGLLGTSPSRGAVSIQSKGFRPPDRGHGQPRGTPLFRGQRRGPAAAPRHLPETGRGIAEHRDHRDGRSMNDVSAAMPKIGLRY